MNDIERQTFNLWYESHLPDLPLTRWDFFIALRCAFLAGVAVGEVSQDDVLIHEDRFMQPDIDEGE